MTDTNNTAVLISDEQIEQIWHKLDGKNLIAGESSLNWNRVIRIAFARAILELKQPCTTRGEGFESTLRNSLQGIGVGEIEIGYVLGDMRNFASSQPIAEDVRDAVLDQVEEAVTTLYEQAEPPYLVDICNAIQSLKSQPQHPPCEGAECGTTGAVQEPVIADQDIRQMAQWIKNQGPVKDHACERCNGTMVFQGFTCAYHKAIDLLAAPAAQHMAHNDGGEES